MAGYRYFEISESFHSIEELINCLLRGDRQTLEYWSGLYNKYFKLNKKMQEKVEDNYRKLMKNIQKKNKILGVKFRLTDYVYALPKTHSIQPSIEEMVMRTKKVMEAGEYGYIYLTVEDRSAIEIFRKEFGEKLIYYDCPLAKYDEGESGLSIAKMASEQIGKKRSGEDYLIGIMLLAKCDALLASENSGTVIAVLANGGKYENVYFVDHGRKQ